MVRSGTRSLTRRQTERETLAVLTREVVALKGRVGQQLYEIGVRLARVHDFQGTLLGVGEEQNGNLYPRKVLASG